jgi:hypothetical protein
LSRGKRGFFTQGRGLAGIEAKRDSSLRRPICSQEANVTEKASACFVRNDGAVGRIVFYKEGAEYTEFAEKRRAG